LQEEKTWRQRITFVTLKEIPPNFEKEKVMFINPEDQAIALLQDIQLEHQQREFAAHYLAEHHTPAGIQALVDALQYKEFALRWIASTALAQLIPLALPEVLRALTNPQANTATLREAVIHILHYGSNLAHEPVYKHQHIEPEVYIKPGKLVSVSELMTALKGPAADINSMKAADKLLLQLENYPAASDDT
jgi:hypothetical protein